MTQKVSIGLDLRNAQYGTAPGYTETTAANNTKYYYKYSGGSDGNGTVEVPQGTPTEITVTVGGDARYGVADVKVTNDVKGDITTSHSGKTATINDSATDLETGMYYKVTVSDSTANTTFDCDPRIDNVPPN